MCAFHAEPGALRDIVETDTVRVIGCIAVVAQEQDVLVFCRIADRARPSSLLFFGILVEPRQGIEFGYLFLVLDFVCVEKGACLKYDRLVYEDAALGLDKGTRLQSCHKPRQDEMPGGRWDNCLPCHSMLSSSCHAECGHKLG